MLFIHSVTYHAIMAHYRNRPKAGSEKSDRRGGTSLLAGARELYGDPFSGVNMQNLQRGEAGHDFGSQLSLAGHFTH